MTICFFLILKSINFFVFQKFDWTGSPLFHQGKILAICNKPENQSGPDQTFGVRVSCRKTNTVFDKFVLPKLNIEKKGDLRIGF